MSRLNKYDISRVMVGECRRNKRRKSEMLDCLADFERLESILRILLHFKYMLRFVADDRLSNMADLGPQFRDDLDQCFEQYDRLLTGVESEDSQSGPARLIQFIIGINENEYDQEEQNLEFVPFKSKCEEQDEEVDQFLKSSTLAEDAEALNQSFSLINEFVWNIVSSTKPTKRKTTKITNKEMTTTSISTRSSTNNNGNATTSNSTDHQDSPTHTTPTTRTRSRNPSNNQDNPEVMPQSLCETIMPREKRKRTSKKPSYVAPKFSSISYLSEATKKAEMIQILSDSQLKIDGHSDAIGGIGGTLHENEQNTDSRNNNCQNVSNDLAHDEFLEIESDILQVEFWCSFQGCLFKSKSLQSVKQHELQRHVKQVLSCCMDGCSQVFESKEDLDQHMEDAHSNSKSFLCTIDGCNHKFPNKFRLRAHVKEKHEDQYLVCKLCDKVFKTRKNRADHLRMIHDEGEYKCTEEGCDFVANIRQRLQDHKKFRHFKMRPCTVEGCGEMVPRFRLSHHLNLKHKISNYVCSWPDCGKSFGDNSTLKGHVRIHLNFKRFKCKWTDCTYASEQRHTVISHVRLCHLKLPRTKKKQMELNISDDSIALNAYDFVETCREDICV